MSASKTSPNRVVAMILAVVPVLVCCGAVATRANEITFTEVTIASGSLDGKAFINAPVTFTLAGDTNNLKSGSPGDFSISGIGSVFVAGFGSVTFTDAVGAFVNQTASVAGISDFTTDSDILGTTNPAFSSYELTTAIGPLSGNGIHNPPTDMFSTSGGAFDLSSVLSVTYTAAESLSPVPEPSSLLLLGTGLAGLLGMGIWKRTTASRGTRLPY